MSHTFIPGHIIEYPFLNREASSGTSIVTLNATGETCHMIGYIMLENPLGGAKTISSSGGGAVVWQSSSVTFANAGSTFEVGIQDVSSASSPGQGDGVFDVKAVFTGGGGGVTTSSTQSSVMTSGTKTIAHGDLVSVTMAMTARSGADSVAIVLNAGGVAMPVNALIPMVSSNTGGSYTRVASVLPNFYIAFDDGTIGWVYGLGFATSQGSTVAFNNSTGTADEYGNLINLPTTFSAIGIASVLSASANSADFELLLYSNPFVTPAVERTLTVDATQLGAVSSTAKMYSLFSSPFFLRANTDYVVSIRPITANNLTVPYSDTNSSVGGKTGYPNSNCYAVRRLDNSGAFSDYNSGTAKTRLMYITLVGASMETGVNSGNYRIGI